MIDRKTLCGLDIAVDIEHNTGKKLIRVWKIRNNLFSSFEKVSVFHNELASQSVLKH